MRKTIEQKIAQKFEKFLSSLNAESEILGLLGEGFPHSFYRVYVRSAPGKPWWKVAFVAKPVKYDPLRRQGKLPVKHRTGAVWGPLLYVLIFDYQPCEGQNALALLHQRAHDLLGSGDQHHVVSVKGARSR